MKNLEGKIGFGATIFSLILALATSLSCSKKEKVFAYISEGPPSKEKIKNPAMSYYEKALKFKEQGQLDSALFYSQKVIDNRNIMESESLSTIHVCRAEIFKQLSKNKEAIEDYDEALTLSILCEEDFDKASSIAFEISNLYEKLNNKEKANECKKLSERFEEYLKTH